MCACELTSVILGIKLLSGMIVWGSPYSYIYMYDVRIFVCTYIYIDICMRQCSVLSAPPPHSMVARLPAAAAGSTIPCFLLQDCGLVANSARPLHHRGGGREVV